MTQKIPEIKIGTTMNELEKFVQTQKHLSESAKNSIFNIVQDEKEFGDKKITNKVELSMILGFLRSGKAEMPENIQADEKGVTMHKNSSTDENSPVVVSGLTLYKDGEEDTIITTEHKDGSSSEVRRYYRSEDNLNSDTLVDEDNDGIADKRIHTFVNEDGKLVRYVDENADGKFDTKQVQNDENSYNYTEYVRDDNGNWVLKNP